MNELLLLLEIILTFSTVVLVSRAFGKIGLTVWVGVATVLANIMTAKTVVLFGMDATLGTVLFASTFLATDVLTECYDKEDAKKAVILGALSALAFIVSAQIALSYIPAGTDFADSYMTELFALNIRISMASITMYIFANLADIYVYNKLREKTSGRKMWLRNNIATILCNCLENFGFVTLAFLGVLPFNVLLGIAVSTSIIEVLVAVADTPFLYLATAKEQ